MTAHSIVLGRLASGWQRTASSCTGEHEQRWSDVRFPKRSELLK